jgi:hypothetical protein
MIATHRRYATQGVAIASILLAYALTAVASRPRPEDDVLLARRFRFEAASLPTVTPSKRTLRPVRRSLRPIAAWISSVGAAVALHDLDGDGLSNDVVYVDVRSDEVVVAPVPGTGARFQPFDLLRAAGCTARPATAPMGAVPNDVNEDGLADVLVYFWGRSPLIYVRRAGPLSAGAFVCRELVTPAEEWYTNAAAFADVDGDGHADLIVGNYFRDGSGVLDPASTSAQMEMQDSMSRAFNGGANRLLLWSRGGVFRDVRGVFPEDVARGWTLAVGAQDLDGDLLPEIYFANDFGTDRLLRNRSTPGHPRFELIAGRRGFFDPKSKVMGRDSFKGMGIDFADLNGDAVPDFFVSNITDPFALEESNFLFLSTAGTLDYHDTSEWRGLARSGWGWDARFGDFDNDGTPELMQATGFVRGTTNRWPQLHELAMTNDTLLRRSGAWPSFVEGTDLSGGDRNPFFVLGADGRYHDVAAQLGMPPATISRGIATADVDGDGRLDFAVANQWQASSFFHNIAPHPGAALVLYLRIPVVPVTTTTVVRGAPHVASSPAIGATATVRRSGGVLTEQVDGGNGHSGKRAPELHFGLGRDYAATVDLRWRDRNGAVRRERVRLEAGAWTVLLASRGRS